MERKSRRKVSKESRYYLYVIFDKQFRINGIENFTYNSIDNRGELYAVRRLKVVLWQRKLKDRCIYAKLVNRETGEVEILKAPAPLEIADRRLAASVILNYAEAKARKNVGMPDLVTIPAYARLTDDSWRTIALQEILQQLQYYKGKYVKAFIYEHPTNMKVAMIDASGKITALKPEMYNSIVNQLNTEICQ